MDLQIEHIADVGGDNERIVLRVLSKCDIGKYLLFRVEANEEGVTPNQERLLFVFPSKTVDKGDYVSVFSKIGEDKVYKNRTGSNTYAFYWKMKEHIWTNKKDKIYLVQYDSWEFKDGVV